MKDLIALRIAKNTGSKIVQVKGVVPKTRHHSMKRPPAKPLGEICYDITFSSTKELFTIQVFFCLFCFIFSMNFHGVV